MPPRIMLTTMVHLPTILSLSTPKGWRGHQMLWCSWSVWYPKVVNEITHCWMLSTVPLVHDVDVGRSASRGGELHVAQDVSNFISSVLQSYRQYAMEAFFCQREIILGEKRNSTERLSFSVAIVGWFVPGNLGINLTWRWGRMCLQVRCTCLSDGIINNQPHINWCTPAS